MEEGPLAVQTFTDYNLTQKNVPTGGFNYDNCLRNKALLEKGNFKVPGNMKTGTTICGVIFKVQDLSSLYPQNSDFCILLT